MPEPSDEALCRALSEGREDAYAALYDRLAPRLYRLACRILRDSHEAEDAVQEAFVALVRGRKRLAEIDNLNAYVFTTLFHIATRKAASRRDAVPLDALAVEEIPDDRPKLDSGEELERTLRTLPREQREVLALRFDAGLAFEEIARTLEVSLGTVSSRYRYALEKLRRMLRTEQP